VSSRAIRTSITGWAGSALTSCRTVASLRGCPSASPGGLAFLDDELFPCAANSGQKLASGVSRSRREVARLGVQVIVIEPGTVATGIWSKGLAAARELAAKMPEAQQVRYRDLLAAASRQAEMLERSGIDPIDAATVFAGAIEARKPRTRYLVGRDAKLMAPIATILPDRIVDWLIARNLGLGEPEATSAAETHRVHQPQGRDGFGLGLEGGL
jgi:hypothetical protein